MKKIIFAACALFMVAACSKSEEGSSASYELRLSSQIATGTRAEGINWEANDKIGVFLFAQTPTQGEQTKTNVPYQTPTAGESVAFTAAGEPLYYPNEGTADVVAYYPYAEQMQGVKYTVDASTQSDLPSIDLMVASKSGVEKSENALEMSFTHSLARLIVRLVPAEGIAAADLADAKISLVGLVADAEYDLVTKQITLGESKPSISLNQEGLSAENLTAEAILVPQTASFEIVVETSAFGRLAASFTDKTFLEGKQHIYTLEVQRTALDLDGGEEGASGGIEIKDWTTVDEGSWDADNTSVRD